jgi:rhamnosyltransferase
MTDISIIIRTKNEERWIGHCLAMIEKQDFKDFEVILVDNESTDHTVEIAKRYNLAQIVNISKFRPGNAINEGIRVSKGKYIVCLSAHCIPKNTNWLSILRKNFDTEKNIAGVYGRQLPVSFTDAVDIRDLLLVFGQDRRIQIKDYFFHNANSIFPREIWEKFTFDEDVTNIEDRVWGKAVIEAGYQIIYDPEAEVYHHHGLHQGNIPKRAKGVVSIIKQVDKDILNELPESLRPENANIAAILPIQQEIHTGSLEEKLLEKTISSLKEAKYVDNIYLITSNLDYAERYGVKIIARTEITCSESMSLDSLLQATLIEIEKQQDFPEALLYVNYDYAFRPNGLFDKLILDTQYKGYDSVFTGFVEYGHYWFLNGEDEFKQTDPSMKPRDQRNPIYKALYGLGCVTSSEVLRKGKMIGGKIGILPVEDPRCGLRVCELASEKVYEAYKSNL